MSFGNKLKGENNMGQIAFWGIQHGLGVTSNTAALASMIGMDYQIRTLCSQPQWSDNTLESSFKKSINRGNPEFYNMSGTGLDGLERAVRAGKIERDTVKNNALFIERDRLDLLRGSEKSDKSQFDNANEIMRIIYNGAKEYYDLVLLDVHSGSNSPVTNTLLEDSDLIVVCVNQNIHVLDKFFKDKESLPKALLQKPHVLLVGQYDPESKYKVRNIANKYSYKGPILTLPYNTSFKDHLNDGDIKGFISRNRNISKNHENYQFIQDLRRNAKYILTEVGINTQVKMIERGAS